MKILLIMDPGIPVPPQLYGGHERLVFLFANEYARMGYDVTVLAGPGSHCPGTTITFGVNNLGRSRWQRWKEVSFVWKFLRNNHSRFDLIHNFGRLAYLIPVLNKPLKKIMTYGRQVAPQGIRLINALPNRNLIFTACSDYCVSTGNVAGKWVTVYNAIDFCLYDVAPVVAEDAPLMFLGRLDKIKGVHTAIQAAKMSKTKLWIAGNLPETEDNLRYFQCEIEPQFDGDDIIYLGALNDLEKNNYLRKAKALLFPIEWDEPFGLVMIEAMACGTPVIAFNKGSVPEVVENGTNGFIVADQAAMVDRITAINKFDRLGCRKAAMQRFDVKIIAETYLNL